MEIPAQTALKTASGWVFPSMPDLLSTARQDEVLPRVPHTAACGVSTVKAGKPQPEKKTPILPSRESKGIQGLSAGFSGGTET